MFNGGTFASVDGNTHFTGTANFAADTLIQRQWGTGVASGAPLKALFFDGVVSGSSTITLQTLNATGETGVTQFTNNLNTFNGTLVVNNTVNTAAGTALFIGGNTALQFATVNLNGNGTGFTANRSIIFASGITAPVIGSLTGSGNVTLETTAGVGSPVGNNNAVSDSYSGVLSDPGAFTKVGTGTQTLSGTNTYLGATNVNVGKLVINGDNSGATGAVTVASGATLAGNGTVGGATTIQSGGIHGSGNSPGVQKFTSDLTYADASIFSWEIDRTKTQTRGTGYDGVNVTGTLAGLDGGDVNTTTDAFFRIVIGDSDFGDTFWSATQTWTDIFTAADGTSAISNWASIFNGGFQYYKTDGSSATGPDALTQGSFTLSGNTLSWSAVSEPTTALVPCKILFVG